MSTNLDGPAKTRARYDLFKVREAIRRQAGQRDHLVAELRHVEAGAKTFDTQMKWRGLRERLVPVVRLLAELRSTADRLAMQLGEDADIAKYFSTEKPRRLPVVRLDVPTRTAARPTVRRTVPAMGFMHRAILGPSR